MISLTLKVPAWDALFKKHYTDIMMALAATMQTNRSMMFDKDGADNDKKKWDNLVLRQGRPLQKTGTLRKSLAPTLTTPGKPSYGKDTVIRINDREVTIGTKIAYAEMMNDGTTKMPGGKMSAVKAKALKIPLESGKFMFRRSVKIPARSMNTISPADEIEFAETLSNYIAHLLNTGGA